LRIGSNAARGQEAIGGQHSPSCVETNSLSLEQGKHRLHNLLYDFTLQTLFPAIVVHLRIGIL
jgi:hypothetical protein